MRAFTQTLRKISQPANEDLPDVANELSGISLAHFCCSLRCAHCRKLKGESCSQLITNSFTKVLSCLSQCQIQRSKQAKIIHAPSGSRITRVMWSCAMGRPCVSAQ